MATSENAKTISTPRTVKVLMLTLTEPWADFLFNLSNIVLIVGAAAVLIGTIGAIAMGGAKEQFSNERISANETATEEAKARALEAQLALARYKAPREISPEHRSEIAEAVKPFAGQAFSGMVASSVSDARPLWASLVGILRNAGWVLQPPWGLATGDPLAGVPVSPNEGVTIFVPKDDIAALAPAANALWRTLNAAGIRAFQAEDSGPQARAKIIVIEIGTKPQ
jgi:hypothetical protein